MNISNPYIKNLNLLKIKQEKEITSIQILQQENIETKNPLLLKDKQPQNKSQIKIKQKSALTKFRTKTYFDNNRCNRNTNEKIIYANKEMKKNLTHRTFSKNKTNTETQNIKNLKDKDFLNNNTLNNKENYKEKHGENYNVNNKEFKIKVKKVIDLNELTIAHNFTNFTNNNTTSSNKNNKAFENEKIHAENFEFLNLKKDEIKVFQQGNTVKVKKSDCEATAEKGIIAKDSCETRKSLILHEFPLFKNSFVISENINSKNLSCRNTNNIIDIETLPNIKCSEENSLINESYNHNNTSDSSVKNKSSNKLLNILERNNDDYDYHDNNNINNNNFNLSLDENLIRDRINRSKVNGATKIKETFTLFMQNNSKKEFRNENASYNTTKFEKEKAKAEETKRNNMKVHSNNSMSISSIRNCINPNTTNFIRIPISKQEDNGSRKSIGIEKNSRNNNSSKIIKKLHNNFRSPPKSNRLKFSKTKNYFSSFSNIINSLNNKNSNDTNAFAHNSISELSQKVANCNNILSSISQNKKLKSDVDILSEKIKTLKKIQQNKNYEIEILKSKYSEAIESYKGEIERNRKLKEKIATQISFGKNLKKILKIFANNLVEITEMLLLSKSSAEKQRASLIPPENASLSIDIYDSYNNEDEKRCMLQEQIQALLLAKFLHFKKNLNLDLEAEIEKIRNWNNTNANMLIGRSSIGKNNSNNNNSTSNYSNISNSNNIEMSISNIKITGLNKQHNDNENDSFESCSKKNISAQSQDYFDLSLSNQFMNLNQIPSGNFGNLGNLSNMSSNNINININQNPQFIFTKNNYNSKQNNNKNPHNNSFGAIDGESDNIFGSNSNNNYNSNANINNNNYNNNNSSNLNRNANANFIGNNKNLVHYSSNKEKDSKCSNIANFNGINSNNKT